MMNSQHTSRVTAVLGPTNTGKTHFAIERMLAHKSGMIGLPLRLLAREVYDKVVRLKGADTVALITGEEKIIPTGAKYYVCTVEAMPVDLGTAFLAVDEIQLCADPERGHVFTDRLLHARGTEETLFMGADTMRAIIRRFVPNPYFLSRARFSDLAYTGPKKLTRLPRRSAVIGFSTDDVYGIADLIRTQRGGAAVVLGALSPRTRNAQVELYQSGEVDFLVATDAIGMGINMDVDHVAFSGLEKFDGVATRPLRPEELGQIAGRAGRHMNDGTFGITGDAEGLDPETVSRIENHHYDPVRVLQWRNSALAFHNIDALVASLEEPPPERGLVKARPASDYLALKSLAGDDAVRAKTTTTANVRLLWDACQLPDFNKMSAEEHARLVRTIFTYLTSDEGVIPEDWFATQVARQDVIEGDVATLSGRLSHIRTWTYAANRPGWLKNAAHWQNETRAVEDRLSDALHEKLTQRFIDRRTSVLMRHLADDENIAVSIDDSGGVAIDGEVIGKLDGFQFTQAPSDGGVHKRTLHVAAMKGLAGEFAARAARLAIALDGDISLSDRGRLWWEGAIVARLAAGPTPLTPKVTLLADENLHNADREAIQRRLDVWIKNRIDTRLEPLRQLEERIEAKVGTPEAIPAEARAVAHQLCENFGALDIKTLPEDANKRLLIRALKPLVWFGRRSVYIPKLLRPDAASLTALLWSVWNHLEQIPALPRAGLTSFVNESELPVGFLAAAGFREVAGRAIRLDMLERLEDTLEKATIDGTTAEGLMPKLVSLIGSGNEELIAVLSELNWQRTAVAAPEPVAPVAPAPMEAATEPTSAETTLENPVADAVEAAPDEAATATPEAPAPQAVPTGPVHVFRKVIAPPKPAPRYKGKPGGRHTNTDYRKEAAQTDKPEGNAKPNRSKYKGEAKREQKREPKPFRMHVNPDSPFAELANLFKK
ncbi:MAG: helicase-related protein [Rhizomicrobium sp.]